jgi:hypothetical protein
MPALVPELVNMASDPAVPTDDLLRRALVIARRLNVSELVEWIDAELNGYIPGQEVPGFRTVRGLLRAIDPYVGRIPLEVDSAEVARALSTMPLRQSITELEHLADSPNGVKINYGHDVHKTLVEHLGGEIYPYVSVTSAQIRAVVSTVRNRILNWALDLEGRGVIGEGMSFTPQEKQVVQEQHYHFGNVSGSQIQISSNGSTQTQANSTAGNDLEALRGLIEALGSILDQGAVQGDAAGELRAELATLKAQAASPRPKWEIIKATARTIKTVAEEAAGNILGELAKPHVATLLALATGAAGGTTLD